MKAGQDEIISDKLLSQYSNAILIPTTIVSKFNKRITDLGDEHIQLLSKMMNYKRKISLVDWETKRLALQAQHLNEYFTDLQVFRVNRGLQKILREGAASEKSEKVSLDNMLIIN